MITVDTAKPGGALPRDQWTNRFIPRATDYGQIPWFNFGRPSIQETNRRYDTLERVQPGRNVRLPNSSHFSIQSDRRSGLIRNDKNGSRYINLGDAFTDNLLLGNRTVYRDMRTAQLLQNDIANRRRESAKAHWGDSANPYASAKGLAHPIVMGPLTEEDRIVDADRNFYTTGNVPIKHIVDYSEPSSYAIMPRRGHEPYIGLAVSNIEDRDFAEMDREDGYARMINDIPVNAHELDNELPGQGILRHELAHLMTDTTPGSETAIDEVYNPNRELGTYANSVSHEALRAHRFMKDVYARHLMSQGLKPEEVVAKVQDPDAFLGFMDSVYNSGEGGGFSLPEGSVPVGLEIEAYRAANGLRPIVAELLGDDSVKAYNSWSRDEELLDRYNPHIVPAVHEKVNPYSSLLPPSQRPVPRRRSLFRILHPQVNNNRSGQTTAEHVV